MGTAISVGIDVGGNDIIVKGLHTLGLEALIITLAAVIGSTLFAWGSGTYCI